MSSALVGRAVELEALEGWWHDALGGRQPSVGVVAGESGVGKSRLAAEFMALRRAAGDRVLFGAATDHGFLPLEPWVGALRAGLSQLPDAVVRQVVAGREREFAALPWLRDLVPDLPSSQLGTPDERAVLAVVVQILGRLAERTPVLVVIEDAQWCDQGSVDLFVGVIRAAVPGCAVLAVERRPGAPRGPWHTADLDLGPRWEQLVPRLAREGCDELVRERLSAASTPQLAAAIFEASGGNAFVALSLIELAGRSTVDAAALAVGLPETAAEIWIARFAPLTEQARSVLAAAAVAGTTFGPRLLGEAMAAAVEVDRAMVEAQAAGLVVAADDGELRFAHALLREHLYASLTATRRQRLHRALALATADHAGSDPSERSAQLAHHFERSGSSGRGPALRHLIAAARWAFEQGAPETASDLCDRALVLLEAEGNGIDEVPLAARRIELGEVLLRLGHPEGVPTMLSAVSILEGEDDTPSLARVADALLRAGEAVGIHEAGTDLAERLIDRLDDVDPRLQSRLLARLSRAMEGRIGVVELQAQLSSRALRLARSSGDHETLAIALHCHATDQPWTDHRIDHIRELVELGRRSQNLEYQLLGLVYLFTLLVDQGDLAGADRALDEACAVGSQVPAGYVGAIKNADLAKEARVLIAYRRVVQSYNYGRFREHRRLLAELGDYQGQSDLEQARLTMVVAIQAGLAAFDDDELAPFSDFVVQFAEEHPEFVQRHICAAFVLAGAGRVDEARARLDPIVDSGLRSVPIDQTTSFMLVVLSWAAFLLADERAARTIGPALEPYRGRNTCCLGGSMGPIDLARALCATTLGDHERAEVLVDAAIDQCERNRVRPYLAWAHLVRAWILRAGRADPATVAAAASSAIRVAECEEGGLAGVVRRAREVLVDADRVD